MKPNSIQIPNFVGNSPIEVCQSEASEEIPATVVIRQYLGSCSFCHHMKPDQARKLAAALLDMADQLDPEELPA